MNELNDSVFQNFCLLSQSVQHIQKKVNEQQMSRESRVAFHRELEGLQAKMAKVSSPALAAQRLMREQFQEIERQIISLYRIVEERFEEFEVREISTKALRLAKAVEKGSVSNIAKRVDDLRHNIHFLFKHRKPSLKNRKIVHLVEKLTSRIEGALSTGKKEHLRMIYFLSTLLKEAINRAEEIISPDEAELVMELYEIAELYKKKRQKEAFVKFDLVRSQLSPSQQKRLEEAEDFAKEMLEILFEITNGEETKAPAFVPLSIHA